MTVVPLPASPCVRIRLDYTQSDNYNAGSRFYLSYSGSAPTGANCITLATDIAAAWATHIAPNVLTSFSLTEVDVLDVATDSGLSGQWNGDNPGTNGGTAVPAQVAMNVEFDIARRYRGGKPRMFLPPGAIGDTVDAGHWSTSFIDATNAAMAAFIAEIAALSVGAMGVLAHVNLSYYQGFTNVTNSSGRTRAAPKYRDAALLDTVTGYAAKAMLGSQKRRRSASAY